MDASFISCSSFARSYLEYRAHIREGEIANILQSNGASIKFGFTGPQWIANCPGSWVFNRVTEVDTSRLVSKGGSDELLKICELKSVVKLNFSIARIDDAVFERIQSVNTIEELTVNSSNLTDRSAKTLSRMSRLRVLNASGTRIGDASVKAIVEHSAITNLDLGGTAITDAALADIAKCGRLRKMSLAFTSVSDTGLSYLRDMADLEDLNLWATACTDAGVGSMGPTPRLSHLNIACVEIQGREVLFSNDRFLSVTQVVVDGNAVSDDGFSRLKRFPNLIVFDVSGVVLLPTP